MCSASLPPWLQPEMDEAAPDPAGLAVDGRLDLPVVGFQPGDIGFLVTDYPVAETHVDSAGAGLQLMKGVESLAQALTERGEVER